MFNHRPVLLVEVLKQLAIKEDGIYVDGTYGRGGHASAILERLGPRGRLLAIDKDPQAVKSAQLTDKRLIIKQGTFAMLEDFVAEQGYLGRVNGIILDLGVSSPQLEEPARGFSFLRDGPLDMRMDNSTGMTAGEWLAKAKESEIAKTLKDYGEERYAKRIARAIMQARSQQPIITTKALANIIERAVPKRELNKHPATRSFQAIRIFINHELEDLQSCLKQCLDILAPGGRLCVISFHSLEDRIVKRFFQKQEKGNDFPKGLPIKHCEIKPTMCRVARAIRPDTQEIAHNPRARSATLRVEEKL